MASTIWKGHITFGLVSIPIKLVRAARPEKVSFRQLDRRTGSRVRQLLVSDSPPPAAVEESVEEPMEEPVEDSGAVIEPGAPTQRPQAFPAPAPVSAEPRQISRTEIAKGFEYEKDRYAMVSKEELAILQPKTTREMEILEFVQLGEVDPIYFETSYYVLPDRSGERPYALLFEALRVSGLVGVAQIAMHNREHIVILRPGRRGIILHTMFYETEIRKSDEFPAEAADVAPKELELALMLVKSLAAPFEPGKYRDSYRERLEALIQSKVSGAQTVEAPVAKRAPVIDLMEALRQSLQQGRKPPAPTEEAETDAPSKSARRGRAGPN